MSVGPMDFFLVRTLIIEEFKLEGHEFISAILPTLTPRTFLLRGCS